MAGWNHSKANWKPKLCTVCGTGFIPKSGINKFCSTSCRGKWKYISGVASTDNQYRVISGNWERYVSRLVGSRGRRADGLTRDMIMAQLISQEYKCALSGRPLTCILSKGTRAVTNASIDRVSPGGPYLPGNIQMVCVALNRWRGDIELDDFISWCRDVAAYSDKHTTHDERGETEQDHGETA